MQINYQQNCLTLGTERAVHQDDLKNIYNIVIAGIDQLIEEIARLETVLVQYAIESQKASN